MTSRVEVRRDSPSTRLRGRQLPIAIEDGTYAKYENKRAEKSSCYFAEAARWVGVLKCGFWVPASPPEGGIGAFQKPAPRPFCPSLFWDTGLSCLVVRLSWTDARSWSTVLVNTHRLEKPCIVKHSRQTVIAGEPFKGVVEMGEFGL